MICNALNSLHALHVQECHTRNWHFQLWFAASRPGSDGVSHMDQQALQPKLPEAANPPQLPLKQPDKPAEKHEEKPPDGNKPPDQKG